MEIQNYVLENFPKWKEFKDKRLRRAFKFLSMYGPATMPVKKVEYMGDMVSAMSHSYSTATVCKYKEPGTCNIRLIGTLKYLKNI